MDRTNNPFLYPLRLPVTWPRSVRLGLIGVHVMGAGLPWLSSLPATFNLLCSCTVLISAIYFLYFGQHASAIRDIDALILDADDNWLLQFRDRTSTHATFGEFQYVTPWLTILGLKHDSKKYFFIYTAENLSADSFRRLRVRILHRLGTDAELT